MEPHEEQDEKTGIWEKLDKFLKGVIAVTCLTGVIAVAWLCTAGKAKARETAKAVPETIPETVAEIITETIAETVAGCWY